MSDAGILIQLRVRDGYLLVTSPDVRGLYLAGKDHEAVIGDLLPVLRVLCEHGQGNKILAFNPPTPSAGSMTEELPAAHQSASNKAAGEV